MTCAWAAYINLLPHWLRQEVDRLGREGLQELRLRIGQPPRLVLKSGNMDAVRCVAKEDIAFVMNAASEYSPWAAGTLSKGYMTAPGGHRVGVCGVATVMDGRMVGIASANSVCLRVARDFQGISGKIPEVDRSLLIIGPPGSGKTTLLRDVIRMKGSRNVGNVSVVDERQEIFPLYKGQMCFVTGTNTDILSGCGKKEGVESVMRNMNPAWIAVDEITERSDCEALMEAGWCGVNLLATAHAGSVADLRTRPVYRPLLESGLFSVAVVLRRDKTWAMERI